MGGKGAGIKRALREDDRIVTSEEQIVLTRVFLVLADPLLLELLESLLSSSVYLLNPLTRCEIGQEVSVILQAKHHILRLLNVTSHVYNLCLQILLNQLHRLPLSSHLIGLPLFLMCAKLILLDELEEFNVIVSKLLL